MHRSFVWILSLLLLFAGCGNASVQQETPTTEISGMSESTPHFSELEEYSGQSEERLHINNTLPMTYENPTQEAIFTFRWVSDLNILEQYPAYRYSVQLLDFDQDGQLEIMVSGSKKVTYGTNGCMVLKIRDNQLTHIGSFDISPGGVRPINDLFLEGAKEYYENDDGSHIIYQWLRTPLNKSNALMEISLKDATCKPILVYSEPDLPEEDRKYFYFETDNFAYNTGGVYVSNNATREVHAVRGYIEITKSEYEKRLDHYLSSLTYCGELLPIYVVEYPESIMFYSELEEYIGIDNFEAYLPSETFSFEDIEKYTPYDDKLNTYVAKKIYEAYMQHSGEIEDTGDK